MVIEPTDFSAPTQSNGVCNTSFWPIVDGATWTYSVTESHLGDPDNTYTEIWTVYGIESVSDRTYFYVSKIIPNDGTRGGVDDQYFCDSSGIYNNSLEALNTYGQPILVLPTGINFFTGYSWQDKSGRNFVLSEITSQLTTFGNRQTAKFVHAPDIADVAMIEYDYIDTIGLSTYMLGMDNFSITKTLIEYQIPNSFTSPIPASDLVQQPSEWVTYLDDPFDGSNGRWQFSDPSSVYLDRANGWLHFDSDGKYDDYAYYPIDEWGLPLMVETRMRLVSGGQGYYLPVIRLYYGSGQDDNIWLTYINDQGWAMYTFTGNHTYAPPSENTWVTVRAIFREDGGEIWAKYDSDTDFTYVGNDYRNVPPFINRIRIFQPWDATMDVDYIIIKYLPIEENPEGGIGEGLDEARIRLILVDIQLSGLDNYYRSFPNDLNASEAIKRWDSGIRVVNINAFERKIIGGQWQIVYIGTETIINGFDVVLSSD